MSVINVYADNTLIVNETRLKCALGQGGVLPAADKREGDGATPAGIWQLRRGYWRADRIARPETALPLRPIQDDDGWCDAPEDPAYNRPVRLPYPASCEAMKREDILYDIVIVLSHNDDPPVPNLGSAVFFHCAKPGYPPTRGCVAIERGDMISLLKTLKAGDEMRIHLHDAP